MPSGGLAVSVEVEVLIIITSDGIPISQTNNYITEKLWDAIIYPCRVQSVNHVEMFSMEVYLRV